MRCRLIIALTAVAFVAGRAGADDNVKAIVEKAVKAHGGKENLEKYKVSNVKGKGTIHIMGMDLEFKLHGVSELPDKLRNEITLEIMGQKIEIVRAFDGKTAWQSGMGATMELEGAQLEEMKEGVHHNYLESIAPLASDKGLEISSIGEEKVGDKPAVGLKVSKKGQKDVRMYFDKESGLLVKMAYKGTDPMGADIDVDAFYSDYKDVQGTKVSMRQEVKHGGEKFIEATLSEAKLEEKADPSLFKKPSD